MNIDIDAIEQRLLCHENLEIGRKAIEDELVELRDMRIGLVGRGNGCVIKERDGTASAIIRLGPEDALRIGIRAIFAAISTKRR